MCRDKEAARFAYGERWNTGRRERLPRPWGSPAADRAARQPVFPGVADEMVEGSGFFLPWVDCKETMMSEPVLSGPLKQTKGRSLDDLSCCPQTPVPPNVTRIDPAAVGPPAISSGWLFPVPSGRTAYTGRRRDQRSVHDAYRMHARPAGNMNRRAPDDFSSDETAYRRSSSTSKGGKKQTKKKEDEERKGDTVEDEFGWETEMERAWTAESLLHPIHQ